MDKNNIMTFFLIIGIVFLAFIVFKVAKTNTNEDIIEGMKGKGNNSGSSSGPGSGTAKDATRPSSNSSGSNNGIAGNSAAYAANIKAQVIKLQDILLISKYRSDYENSIMALDDLVNSLMLEKALSVDMTSPQKTLTELVALNQVKEALNSIMSHVDSSN